VRGADPLRQKRAANWRQTAVQPWNWAARDDAIPNPSDYDEVLLAAVEGNAARIVRVNPRDGSEAMELDLPNILRQHWGIPASYVKLAHAFGPGVTLQGLRFDGDYPMASLEACRYS
jgi:hypothetical protein